MIGDFNIKLLNFKTHHSTDDFINTLVSYFLFPQILQPRRVPDHSSTLIDNTFTNSLEDHSVIENIFHDLTARSSPKLSDYQYIIISSSINKD